MMRNCVTGAVTWGCLVLSIGVDLYHTAEANEMNKISTKKATGSNEKAESNKSTPYFMLSKVMG